MRRGMGALCGDVRFAGSISGEGIYVWPDRVMGERWMMLILGEGLGDASARDTRFVATRWPSRGDAAPDEGINELGSSSIPRNWESPEEFARKRAILTIEVGIGV